jgi:hypothetical protein
VASSTTDETVWRSHILIVAAGWAIPTSPVEFAACVTIGTPTPPGALPGGLFTIARALRYFFNAELLACLGASEQDERYCGRLSASHAHCCAHVFVVVSHCAKHTTHDAGCTETHSGDPKLVADQLGHGLGVNLDVYTVAALDKRQCAVEVLESALVRHGSA